MRFSPRLACVLTVVGGFACAGCELPPRRPAQSLAELEQSSTTGQEFVPRTILLHNIRRVLSSSVSAGERMESLRVVEKFGADRPDICRALAPVLADESAPVELRHSVLLLLIRTGYPDLGRHIPAALARESDAELRSAVLDWLAGQASPDLLGDVVKLWAAEENPGARRESRYRRIVQRMTGNTWDGALLAGLNSADFFARGSAMEVLSSRVPAAQLRRRIAGLHARTPAVRALQDFLARFGYLPRTGRELLATVTAHRDRAQWLSPAARLAREWQQRYGYEFNIRDFHLLGSLATDPLRQPLSREKLILALSLAIAGRGGSRVDPAAAGGFVDRAKDLSMADLWNLMLINEMLGRPRVKEAMSIAAKGDWADRRTQWGGLIRYEQGQAEAKLYTPGRAQGDDKYLPSDQMLSDAMDSLACFVGHFGWGQDGTGPTEREMNFAREQNLCGIVLTRPAPDRLKVVYFNPEGRVVDLGNFPLRP